MPHLRPKKRTERFFREPSFFEAFSRRDFRRGVRDFGHALVRFPPAHPMY